MYLVHGMQKIMGDRELSISPDEYVFAAFELNADILSIFIEILDIISYVRKTSPNSLENRLRRNEQIQNQMRLT